MSRPHLSVVKKQHPPHKSDLDEAVRTIASNPDCGEAKVDDLLGIRVYKFRLSELIQFIKPIVHARISYSR
ncbi:type II toxin-antitoxin system RelE/ParE family toxin [Nitrosomonas aestuarii]|uniref:type II toxin-antitoxin system RelE/ParE family toxin n=1 Tax=Nitrosomonas aestuarii TaxID=52441 RepID=UPI001C62E26D|nr:type II toxin-antitoxin system RelE/ParE family toxin [Nitrosomonas aestuarii]